MATVDELLRRADRAAAEIATLRHRLSHAKSYTTRHTLQHRIRALEDRLDALYRAYIKALKRPPVTVFNSRKKPKVAAGLQIIMDVSSDGRYFSNPSPKIGFNKHIWVRAQIDLAQKSPFSTSDTLIPELIRCTWAVPKRWAGRDVYSRFGRIEYVVSLPLVVTREFTSPGSGTTAAKFGMYADPYYPVDPKGSLPAESSIESGEVTCDLIPGTYHYFARTANVFSQRVAFTLTAALAFIVDEESDTLFYTDGGTYVTARLITSGPYAGKYMDTEAVGVTLTEVYQAT